jgi:hypothetical protein
VAIAEYDAYFQTGFSVAATPWSTSSGTFRLTVNSLSISGDLPPGEVAWYQFQVVPEPSALQGALTMACLGIVAARRRL